MHRIGIAFLAGTLLLGATALSHAQDDKATLAQEVAGLREEVATLRAELDETRELVDMSVAYLERQADAAGKMSRVLDASEQAGFTWGINPESRELLLEGWRSSLAGQQKGLPVTGRPQAGAPDPRDTRGRRPVPGR